MSIGEKEAKLNILFTEMGLFVPIYLLFYNITTVVKEVASHSMVV